MVIGLSAAAHDGPVHWSALVMTVLGIFFIEAAKNASGEIYDWDSGTDLRIEDEDRSPFSGGKRVLVDAVWTRTQTKVVSLAFYALGASLGVVLALREPRILYVAMIGVLLAFFYHGKPIQLAYRGLGELAVFASYGPLIAAGAYLVQRGTVSPAVVWLSVPTGLMVAGFLFINEFPDARADAASGKRTLVVRLGRRVASRAFVLFPLAAFSLVLVEPFLFGVPRGTWLGFVGLPHAVAACVRLWREHAATRRVVPAQAWTLVSFTLLALGTGAGLFWP
jgi:1,4-dihydroxy-2-naphthoate octaprenyltransferase